MYTNAHPTLPEFDYIRPESLAEASRFMAQHADEARLMLGGTDLLVRLRNGALHPKYLVDVKHLDGLQSLRFDPQSGLTIGAAVSLNRVIASPDVQNTYALLAEACRQVASYPLRTRATIVGNLCTASPAGDTIGVCLALDAQLHIHGSDGPRQEPLAGFFVGPGQTVLKSGDVVTAIHLPLPPGGAVGTYRKLGRNRLGSLSIVGVTVLGSPEPGLISGYRFRIVLAAVAPVPLIATAAETYLAWQAITPEAIHQAASLAGEACAPIDDIRAGARYRRLMVKNETKIALTTVWEKLQQQA